MFQKEGGEDLESNGSTKRQRWTRARTRQMEEVRQQAQENTDAHIKELIKTNNIMALIKTDQRKWEMCLIKTGPNSYVMDTYGLPKQQQGVQQSDWVYKRQYYLKSLSVAKRNFTLTGDEAFTFDPVTYTIIYDCFSYANIVRGPPRPPQQPALQVIPNPALPVQALVPAAQPLPVTPNLVQAIPNPVQPVQTPVPTAQLLPVSSNPVQTIPNPASLNQAPVPIPQPLQVAPKPVQPIPVLTPALIPDRTRIIVPNITLHQPEPDTRIDRTYSRPITTASSTNSKHIKYPNTNRESS